MSPAAAGHLAMLLFAALVGGSFSLGSLVANDIAPAALNALRFWLAAGIIGGVALARGGLPRSAFRAPWRYLLTGGLFGFYFVLMFEALKTATPVATSAIFTLTPVMTAFFGWLLLRQGVTRRMTLALTIGAAGAVWVVFRADLAALLRFRIGEGEAIFFIGCIAHSVYIPLSRRLNRGENALVSTFGMLVAGGLLLTLWGWRDLGATDWAGLRPVVWGAILYLAVFASAATFVLLQFATLRLPSAKVMAYTYLTPAWVILWQLALGDAPPPLPVSAGVALSAVALLLLLRDEDHARREPVVQTPR